MFHYLVSHGQDPRAYEHTAEAVTKYDIGMSKETALAPKPPLYTMLHVLCDSRAVPSLPCSMQWNPLSDTIMTMSKACTEAQVAFTQAVSSARPCPLGPYECKFATIQRAWRFSALHIRLYSLS